MEDTRRFVMGDIHGANLALVQCLERAHFNFQKDELIQLGDIVDGWNEVYECVETLMKIKNLKKVKGNHDEWLKSFINNGKHSVDWMHGGEGTLQSYIKNCVIGRYMTGSDKGGYETNLLPSDIPQSHIDFFNSQLNYIIDKDNNFFVHGGFNRHYHVTDPIFNKESLFYWDRDFWAAAMSWGCVSDNTTFEKPKMRIKDNFKEIFLGHTTTMNWDENSVMHRANVWNMDTGAGFNGRLSIMNIDTKEIFYSDPVQDLYNSVGRNHK